MNCEPAKMSSVFHKMSKCPVCSEYYGFEGAIVPRILPCKHTACETCLEKCLSRKKLKCPVCNITFVLDHGVEDIPRNQDIIHHWESVLSICTTHGKDFLYFCNEEGCKRLICLTCKVEEHQNHGFKPIGKAIRGTT